MSETPWYWSPWHCYCPQSSDSIILHSALQEFTSGYWTYKTGGRGEWVQVPERPPQRAADCWYLVAYTLYELGYNVPPEQLPMNGRLDPRNFLQTYFCQVKLEEAGPGDVVFYYSRLTGLHYDLLVSEEAKNGGWEFTTFGAQGYGDPPNYDNDGIRNSKYDVQTGHDPYEGFRGMSSVTVWRPKKCARRPIWPDKPSTPTPTRPRDPLLLDLDGNGISTLGLDSAMHFDHDGNDFKELTGWVAPGDGLLMLDKNGNGWLDNGNELFGDFTTLPDGTRAPSSFQALAYYDANRDGKIDANDPIWPQLKVWTHATYLAVAGEG